MILANYAQQNRNTVRELGNQFTNPIAQFKPSLFHCISAPDTAEIDLERSAFNHGYNTSFAWWPAMKTGGMASTLNIRGEGSISASALAVKLAEASITGTGDLTALGSLIVQAIADLTGSGDITSANLQAFLAAVADLTGSGAISSAALEGFGELLASVLGIGTMTGSNLTGLGQLEADIVVTGTGLTTANVGQAVWDALAAANNNPGTMGEKLNDAGSASNPWTEIIESGYTAEQILRILVAVAAGKTDITGAQVTFRNLGDTKDVVVADMTGSERTTVTLDPT
jgi:hypothetical protein